MGFERALTRVLYHLLPKAKRTHMSEDLIGWIYSDLHPSERQKMIEILQPSLLEMIREGEIGLSLLIYYHLLCLMPLKWRNRYTDSETPLHPRSAQNL
jgi:hypothetical protein